MVQWLGLCTFTAEDPGSIPGQGTKRKEGGNKDNYKKGGGCEIPDVPQQKMGAEPSQESGTAQAFTILCKFQYYLMLYDVDCCHGAEIAFW